MAGKIPTVEFSSENLKPGTDFWSQTSRKIKQALEDHGCFIVETNNNIVSLQLHNSVFTVAEELFDLPYETKIKNINLKPCHGYNVPELPGISPVLEGLNIDRADALEDCKNFTALMWPEGNDRFCQTAHAYAKAIAELEQRVTMMVFESYGLDKYYDSHSSSSAYLLRFLKYKKPDNYTDEEINNNVTKPIAHTDKSFMSILHQNNVRGLEVQTNEGDWFTFEPSPSSFMVMAGSACTAWSNGRIKACYHRVVVGDDSEVRYSIGAFSYQTGMISTPEELIDEQNPPQFKQFDHMSSMCYYEKIDNRIKAKSLNAALLF